MKNINKIKCHSKLDLESSTLAVLQQQQQRPAWKILKQVQDDGLICYNNNGFTLIELLVVVLIIGILAAIAVPQYQQAVMKSRYTQLMAFGNALEKAEQAYYLANGKYTARFDELDIDLPLTGTDGAHLSKKTYQNYTCELSSGRSDRADGITCYLTTSSNLLSYRLVYGAYWRCMATVNWNAGNKICQNMTGRTSPTSYYGDANDSQAVYAFQ